MTVSSPTATDLPYLRRCIDLADRQCVTVRQHALSRGQSAVVAELDRRR